MQTKAELRKLFMGFRSSINPERRHELSISINNKFLNLREVSVAQEIMCYVSTGSEVETRDLITKLIGYGKQVLVPYCITDKKEIKISPIKDLENDLVEGAYGIPEPQNRVDTPLKGLDIVIVPGIVFSRDGYRIGYGGGYYDRFLVKLPDNVLTVGFTYHALLLDNLPIDRYDQPVDMVITERETLVTGGGNY
ncbi:5-formyltetrahydrofolate cyclo-ligase [Halothermothrix orenii]|uniref:5-formyltetrahydrofolate cyclo-ligase n=1 Tax=Halothermothrix orenii (strain H 168 / OCM 544 / DSM 9562) TaxID=373903 RepID=B8CXD5_HALOH|nr:5-formyltetrahydrofolate cyclo-ligase [Halothermothrix orenii]ACL69954.1 5,10-methenyltetrahydrofolate synthetase [Halothermothrix orenii H 168]